MGQIYALCAIAINYTTFQSKIHDFRIETYSVPSVEQNLNGVGRNCRYYPREQFRFAIAVLVTKCYYGVRKFAIEFYFSITTNLH